MLIGCINPRKPKNLFNKKNLKNFANSYLFLAVLNGCLDFFLSQSVSVEQAHGNSTGNISVVLSG